MFAYHNHDLLSIYGEAFKELLPQALTTGRCALWEWRIHENRLSIDPTLYHILGYEKTPKLTSRYCIREHVHPEDLSDIEKTISSFIQRREAFPSFEFRMFDQNGEIIWISCRGKVTAYNKEGDVLCVVGTFIDVTQARKINTKTAERYRMLDRLVENLPGMAYRSVPTENGWRIVFASKGVNKLLGYDQAHFLENVDTIYRNLVAQEDYQRIWDETNQAIRDKRPHQMYYRLRTAFGEYKWVWEQGVVLFSKYGKPIAMEGFIADVTRQKELEIELSKENIRLKSSLIDRYHFGNIIGKSPAMRQLYGMIEKAAESDASVIIYGESGTGKELVARMIHSLSRRNENPFVPVNCGAIPENLLESEFFGYKKGAFSGAHADKKGYLAAAQGGSLFLDELGEISLNFQVKLLRILEGYGYSPLGSTTELFTSDIRFIAATHQDLMALINQNKMREDFFFRVHIIPITLPPLRERREDIPLLIDHFLEQFGASPESKGSADELSIALKGYEWPGNVRELQNTIQRYVTLGELALANGTPLSPASPALSSDNLSSFSRYGETAHPPRKTGELKKIMAQHEKELIMATLNENQWNRQRSAQMLKIGQRSLYRKMKLHGIG